MDVQEASPQGTPFDDISCEPMSQNSSSLQTLGKNWQAWLHDHSCEDFCTFFPQNFIPEFGLSTHSTLPSLNPETSPTWEISWTSKSHEAKIQMTIQQAGQVELAFAHKGMSTPGDEPWMPWHLHVLSLSETFEERHALERSLIDKNMTTTWSRTFKKLFFWSKNDTTWSDSFSKFNRHGACEECNLPPKYLLDGHSQDLRHWPNTTVCLKTRYTVQHGSKLDFFSGLISWIRIKMVLLIARIQYGNRGIRKWLTGKRNSSQSILFPTELLGIPQWLTTCPSFIITEMEIKEPPSFLQVPVFHTSTLEKRCLEESLNV